MRQHVCERRLSLPAAKTDVILGPRHESQAPRLVRSVVRFGVRESGLACCASAELLRSKNTAILFPHCADLLARSVYLNADVVGRDIAL